MLGTEIGLRTSGAASVAKPYIHADSQNGTITGDGSLSAPFATLADAQAAALAEGNGAVVALAAGSVFRESLDLSTLERASVRAYGDVATHGLPVVDGADVIAQTISGPELQPDPSFDVPSAWTAPGGWVVANGEASITNAASGFVLRPSALTANTANGQLYRVTVTVTSVGSKGWRLAVGGTLSSVISTTGTHTIEMVGDGVYGVGIRPTNGGDVGTLTVTDFSVIPISGVALDTPWQDSTDRSDVYGSVYTRTIMFDGQADTLGGEIWPLIWQDGNRLTWAPSLADCEATPGTWYTADLNATAIPANAKTTATSISVHVHPAGSTNPNTDGSFYEATKRMVGVVVGDRGVVRLIHGKRAGQNSGSIAGGLNCLFERCLGSESARHNMLMASGEFRDCIGWQQTNDPRWGEILLEFYHPSVPAGTTGIWTRCMAIQSGPIPGVLRTEGFGGHTSDGSRYARWTMKDCVVVNCEANDSIDVEHFECLRLRSIDGLIKTRAAVSTQIVDPYFTVTSAGMNDHSGGLVTLVSEAPSQGVTIDGLRAYIDGDLPGSANAVVLRPGNLSNAPVHLSCSVIAGTAALEAYNPTYVVNVHHSASAETVTLHGVVVDFAQAPNRGSVLVTPADTTVNGSDNIYWGHSAEVFFLDGTRYTDPQDWLNAAQPHNEAGSLSTDPGLIDPANGDFRIGGTGLPSSAGLRRPDIHYPEPPATLQDAHDLIASEFFLHHGVWSSDGYFSNSGSWS